MTDPIMNTKDSGRLRIMEKLCSDKKLNTVLLVLANGECFIGVYVSFMDNGINPSTRLPKTMLEEIILN